MTEHKIPIPGRIYNASGGNVCGTDDIIDDVKGKKQSQINAEVDSTIQNEIERATEAENNRYTKDEVYSKEETYNKNELNNLITTPEVNYVNVEATDQTTDISDVLPVTGAADTIYKIGSWDGSQYDASKYSEYSWNGNTYVYLATRDHGVDDEPTAGSDNLVKSGGVAAKFQQRVVVSYINEQPSSASVGEFALYIPDMSLRKYVGYGWQVVTDLSPYKEVVVNGINDIYITYKIENNQIVRLCNSYTKANATINGALNNGVIININGFKTTDFISCEGLLTYTWSGYALQDGWNIISFYGSADENSFISGYGPQSAGNITTINIPVPMGAKYFRCTFSNDYSGKLTEGLETFWSKCLSKNNVQYDFAVLSFNNIGLLRYDGTLNKDAVQYHTTDYIPCDPKIAQISANIKSVNSADWCGICFYSDDKEESFISGIAATGTATEYNPITIPSGAKYLRIGTSLTYGKAYIKILEIGGFVVTQNQKIIELDKTVNKKKKIVCIGDSLTYGVNGSYDSNGNAVSPAVTYEKELQSMLGLGYDIINLGVGGESTNTILGRVGVIPYALSNKVTLPASSASKVAVNIVSSYDFTSQVQPLRQGNVGLRYCFVDNIKCNLTYDNGTYYLNRVEDAVNPSIIGAKTLIIPEAAEKYKDADIVIVWTGSNDGASQSDYQMQIDKFKQVESFYNNATCLFMVQHQGTETSTQDADKAFNSAFGSRFINFRNYASNQGIYDAIDKGWLNKITYKSGDDTSIILSDYSSYLTIVEYSVTDVEDIAVGRTPVSFTNFLRNQEDTLHLNSDGFKTLALLIFNRLKQLNL